MPPATSRGNVYDLAPDQGRSPTDYSVLDNFNFIALPPCPCPRLKASGRGGGATSRVFRSGPSLQLLLCPLASVCRSGHSDPTPSPPPPRSGPLGTFCCPCPDALPFLPFSLKTTLFITQGSAHPSLRSAPGPGLSAFLLSGGLHPVLGPEPGGGYCLVHLRAPRTNTRDASISKPHVDTGSARVPERGGRGRFLLKQNYNAWTSALLKAPPFQTTVLGLDSESVTLDQVRLAS